MSQASLVAGHTTADFIQCTGGSLIGPIRIGYQGAADPYHVALLQRQNRLRFHWVVVAVGGQDWDRYSVLHRLG